MAITLLCVSLSIMSILYVLVYFSSLCMHKHPELSYYSYLTERDDEGCYHCYVACDRNVKLLQSH